MDWCSPVARGSDRRSAFGGWGLNGTRGTRLAGALKERSTARTHEMRARDARDARSGEYPARGSAAWIDRIGSIDLILALLGLSARHSHAHATGIDDPSCDLRPMGETLTLETGLGRFGTLERSRSRRGRGRGGGLPRGYRRTQECSTLPSRGPPVGVRWRSQVGGLSPGPDNEDKESKTGS